MTIINPNFEDIPDFYGWQVELSKEEDAWVQIHELYKFGLPGWIDYREYYPIDGSKFALLKTNGGKSYARIYQQFHAEQGDKISGWTFFYTAELTGTKWYESAEVCILDEKRNKVATLFHASSQTAWINDWTQWDQYEFSEAGNYFLEGRVTNHFDSLADSYLGIDAIQYTSALQLSQQPLTVRGMIPVE